MEPDEALAAPEPDNSAPPAEAPEASGEPTPDAEAPTSMYEAFQEAVAEQAGEESKDAASEDAKASPETPPAPDSEAAPQTPADPEPRKVTSQGELDRIQTLIDQGREAELEPAARGVLRKLEARVLAGQQREEGFRKLYLDYEGERVEDPDAFADKVLDDPGVAQFMKAYKSAHPDISLENPTAGPKAPDPAEVRARVIADYDDAVTRVAAELTTRAGLDTVAFAKIQTETGGNVGELLVRSWEAAIEAKVEQMKPEITRKEREAAELEAQARYANKTIITPRAIGGVPVTGEKSDPSKPFSMGDALRESRAELEAAGV